MSERQFGRRLINEISAVIIMAAGDFGSIMSAINNRGLFVMQTTDFATVISAINVIFLVSLIYIYATNYMKLKSRFALGLILFALLVLLQNVAALYFQLIMVMYYSSQVAGIAFILNSLEACGLAVLVYISWK